MNTTRKDIDIRAMQLEQGPLLEVKNLQVDFTTDSKKLFTLLEMLASVFTQDSGLQS